MARLTSETLAEVQSQPASPEDVREAEAQSARRFDSHSNFSPC